MTPWLRKFIVAAFVVFLHYCPQITVWMDQSERYCDWWSRRCVLWILLGTAVLASAAVAVDWLVLRLGRPWLTRLFNHVFLLLLASGALAAVVPPAEENSRLVNAVWVVALAAIVGSLLWRRSPLVRWAAAACLIFSPLAPILCVQMLLWPNWGGSMDPLPPPQTSAQAAGRGGGPVYFFVFDEWSWLRSTRDGQWRDCFPSVRRLCEQAVLFRHALSPFRETMQSLPRLIYQTDRRFAIRNGRTYFENGRAAPTVEAPSLFQPARREGCATILLGFYHPYRCVLGPQVDCCRCYFPGDDGQGDLFEPWSILRENARYWTDPLSRAYGAAMLDAADAACWHRMGTQYRADMLRTLAESPRRSAVFFHVPSPHAPYVFNPDGSWRGPDKGLSDVEAYLCQLEYVDVLVGQIVKTLKDAGRFDDALLIFTSDHGWRFDPDAAVRQDPEWERRVPLVVKLPHERVGRTVDAPFYNNQLMPLLRAAFRGEDAGKLLP